MRKLISLLFYSIRRRKKPNEALLRQLDELLDVKLYELYLKLTNTKETTSTEPQKITSIDNINKYFTRREIVVLELVVQGKTNKEIAAEIYLSEGGIKNIMTRLFGKCK